VKENLFIEHVELKTESDPDVSPYIYEKDVEVGRRWTCPTRRPR